MLNISNGLLEKLSLWKNNQVEVETQNKMDVHLVNQNDIFYHKGRALANEVYNQVWGTEKLIDDNDYGIVITHNGKVVGNVNIQVRKEDKPLKSEKFFGKEHWQCCSNVDSESIYEMSGLSIAKDVAPELRQTILMLLIFSTYTLTRSLGRTFCVSVQRKALIRILTKHLHIPVIQNTEVTEIQGEVPQDAYWQDGEKPQLYYIDCTQIETIENINSFFFYFQAMGIQTNFMSRFHPQPTSYAKFRKMSVSRPVAV